MEITLWVKLVSGSSCLGSCKTNYLNEMVTPLVSLFKVVESRSKVS